jgi:hypothetical protein
MHLATRARRGITERMEADHNMPADQTVHTPKHPQARQRLGGIFVQVRVSETIA